MNIHENITGRDSEVGLRPLSATEILAVAGGFKAVFDEEGNMVSDCTGRYVKFGSLTIHVPWGTVLPTA